MLNQINLSRADLNLLVLFEAVLEERHVGRAAERLSLTASAVSHGLGRLRRQLNDPLFLRTPKGVVPTDRARDLALPIAEVLSLTRNILSTAAPFDAATSTRRFTIGAPDGISATLLPALFARLAQLAPGIDISLRQLMPAPGEPAPERAWRHVLTELETRHMDIAVIPLDDVPLRFESRVLYVEDFVIVTRVGHPFTRDPSLKKYAAAAHLVVSATGDPLGFVDQTLAKRGLKRRVSATVPNFMLALAMISETNLIAAIPRKFAAIHAQKFKVAAVEAPLPLRDFRVSAVVSKAAAMDAGVAWLSAELAGLSPLSPP